MTFLNGYQQSEATTLANLCSIAYEQEGSNNYATIKNAIQVSLARLNTAENSSWQLLWLGISPDYANLMFLAENNKSPGTLVISHRCTDWSYLDDVKEDMDVYHTSPLAFLDPPQPGIYVAKGAMDGLLVLQQMTDTTTPVPGADPKVRLLDLIQALQKNNPLHIYITGHSLGGALATLFTTWILETLSQEKNMPNPVNIKTYTIASPTVGNKAYADYYNSQANQTGPVGFQGFRIHNMQDLVPHAFAELQQLPGSGIPMNLIMKTVLTGAADSISAILKMEGLAYVHGGEEHALNNANPKTPPTCANPAGNLKEYSCWVAYEHDLNTYLTLI